MPQSSFAPSTADSGAQGGPNTPRTVMVIDDDEAIRNLVTELLVDEGYHVLSANNGAHAMDILKDGQPDLILLDMRMPVMDGWAFASEYHRSPGPHAPIVVITAATDARATADEVGASAALAKPFDLDDLIDVVVRFVDPPTK